MAPLPSSANIVIIGGGFAGAATAYALGRRGVKDVVLVEKENTCGQHASGRNAAMCRELVEDSFMTDLTVAGAAFLRDPPAGFSNAPLLRRTGSVLLVDSPDDMAALTARACGRQLRHEEVTPRAIAARWPTLTDAPCAGGVFFPDDGIIDVHSLLQGFLSGARADGVHLEVACQVTDLRGAQDRAVVVTNRGSIEAVSVVNAAGAWVERLGNQAGARGPHFAPMQRHLFVTAPTSEVDVNEPFVWHIGQREFYVRPEGAGYLLSGCDETEVAPQSAVTAAGAAEHLAEVLGQAAPNLAHLQIARAWACLRTFAPDRRAVISRDPDVPWLYWVAGLGGHGATASAAVGERAAKMLVCASSNE